MSFAIAAPSVASAHPATDFYWAGWANQSDVKYKFRDNLPGGNFRDRVFDGFHQWNDTPNDGAAEPDFNYGGETTANGDWDQPCNANFSGVYYKELDVLDPGVLGYTPFCFTHIGPPPSGYDQVTRFSFNIDNDRNWYTGTGDAPAGIFDLWSLATHEIGHATGWYGHFSEGNETICPNDSTRHTMCPSIYDGTERQRTLEEHDYHTFENAYPWP